MGTKNTYVKKDVIHWATDGAELKVLEKVFPIDVLTGDTHAVILGKESTKHAGTYGASLHACVRIYKDSDWEEKQYDTLNLIWR